jgi:uncharacterized protein
MLKRTLTIGSIPALVWGNPSRQGYIFVHGKSSQKGDAAGFAKIAENKSCQVISFDLPGHGDRRAAGDQCTVQEAVHDLRVISDYVSSRWSTVSLFASSLGAYFSLVAYPDLKFNKCLFQSPILDMENLIRNMLKWSGVTEELLSERQEIQTAQGETLSWPYYVYVRAHPIVKWNSPTWILYGSRDHLTPGNIVEAFAANFHCSLEVVQDGEHYFHTKEQLAALEQWIDRNI